MKYSEGLFKFPIKVYDSLSITKAMLKEDLKLNNVKDEDDIEDIQLEDSDWVRGFARIPIQEIKAWTDIFSGERNVKEVAEEGFTETMIITKSLGNFECLWTMKKFEEEVDKFAEAYTKSIDSMVEESMKEKAHISHMTPTVVRKRKWGLF